MKNTRALIVVQNDSLFHDLRRAKNFRIVFGLILILNFQFTKTEF